VLKALVDTNQLVSSLLSHQGLQRRLIEAWRRREFLLLLVPGQIDEVSEVLARPKIAKKYRIEPGDREAFIRLLNIEAIVLPHAPAPQVCRDPDDDYLLGCAALGGAHYLVTGDDDLLALRQYGETVIVDARTFLSVLATGRR
jgi:hypothetical protein